MEKTIDYEGKYEEWKNGTIAKDMFKLVEVSKLSLNDEFMQKIFMLLYVHRQK